MYVVQPSSQPGGRSSTNVVRKQPASQPASQEAAKQNNYLVYIYPSFLPSVCVSATLPAVEAIPSDTYIYFMVHHFPIYIMGIHTSCIITHHPLVVRTSGKKPILFCEKGFQSGMKKIRSSNCRITCPSLKKIPNQRKRLGCNFSLFERSFFLPSFLHFL